MTEDNENMEVDDILSSIKSILEEDENTQGDKSAVEDVSSDNETESSTEDDEDIIELSEDMRIAENADETVVAENTVNQIDEGSPLDLAIGDIDNNAVATEQALGCDDILTAEVETNKESEAETKAEDSTLSYGEEDVKPEDVDFVEQVITDTAEIVEDTLPAEAEVIAQDSDVADTQLNEAVAVSDTEINSNTEAEPEIKSMAKPELEPMAAPEKDVAAEEAEIKADDAVDVSANIISNFAKMFARGGNADKKKEGEPLKIVELGQGSKTLEGFVKDAVVSVIGDDIAKQWNNGADYYNLAESEIKRQVQDWINNNLPVMIERIVKEEIARVIEKVGS